MFVPGQHYVANMREREREREGEREREREKLFNIDKPYYRILCCKSSL